MSAARPKRAARPFLLIMLLLASAGIGWAAVTLGMKGGPGLVVLPSPTQPVSWHETALATAREVAEASWRIVANAGAAIGETLDDVRAAVLPEAVAAVAAAREMLRDPRHGPPLVGGIGLAAGLAFGLLLGRRARSAPLHPQAMQAEPTHAEPMPGPAVAPAPASEAPPPPPLPPAERPVPPSVAATPPVLPPAPLLAGTVAHHELAVASPPLPPEPPQPANDADATLIAAIVTIFAEEARAQADAGPERQRDAA